MWVFLFWRRYCSKNRVSEVRIQLPETAFSALRKDPQELAREMRIVAAVKWYDVGEISQGQAAEIAGLNLAEFINILLVRSRNQVFSKNLVSEVRREHVSFVIP